MGIFMQSTKRFAKNKRNLPGEVGKCLVGLGHLVDVLTLLDRFSFVLRSSNDLVGEFLGHRGSLLVTGGIDNPAKGEEHTAFRADFTRDLIVGTTDTARADFHQGARILECGLVDFHRVLYLEHLLDLFHGVVHDGFGNGLFPAPHHIVDERGDFEGMIFRIWLANISIFDWSAHRGCNGCPVFSRKSAVLRHHIISVMT